MGADAVSAALAVGYVGAGTVEFIVDADLKHYFLEMNTRLQVEHPVTECITGLDLVEWQLRVAAGDPLPLVQEAVRFTGHAIEARLYAEDPYAGFAPQTGRVLHWRPDEALRPGVRIDSGIAEGGQVTPFYDAMVAKVIAHGRDRADAIRRLTAALEDAPLVGLRNNGRFLRDLLAHPAFGEARMHTTMLDDWASQREPLLVAPDVGDATWRLAAAVFASRDGGSQRPASVSAWDLSLQSGDQRRTLRVRPHGERVEVSAEGTGTTVDLFSRTGHELRYAENGVLRSAVCVPDGDALHLVQDGAVVTIREVSPWPSADDTVDPRLARAPVAGTVAAISVAPGDVVEAGQQLVCVEAMKMEMWLVARSGGRVRAVHVELKESVEAGVVLVELEIEENA
jgi:geranyl-CoA carboxylase alpha subunit